MLYRKFNRKKRRRPKRYKTRNRHHFLCPRARGGDSSDGNLLLMHIERHEAWHKLFGLKTADEALALLERVVRLKKRQLRAA